MPKKKVTKVKLADLLGKEGKANADLHKDNPEKRKNHLRYRTPRNRLITPKGSERDRPLSGDPASDLKRLEVAREFISNGFDQTKAYAAVYGCSLKSAKPRASKLFNSATFIAKVAQMMQGTDGNLAKLPKEYLLQKLVNVIELNILDYIGDDGRWLTVEELRQLPLELQQELEDFRMTNTIRHVALKDVDGNVIRQENGEPHTVEVKEQQVFLKLPSKQAARDLLAKVMNWITLHVEHSHTITAETLMNADKRVERLRRDDIEGESERVATD